MLIMKVSPLVSLYVSMPCAVEGRQEVAGVSAALHAAHRAKCCYWSSLHSASGWLPAAACAASLWD